MSLNLVVKRLVIAEANKATPIGNFIPGTYRIPANEIN